MSTDRDRRQGARPEEATAPRDLGRQRAARAWAWVHEVKGKTYETRYGTLARKLPSYLQVSGLGQTMAFLFSRGTDTGERALYEHLSGHLRAHFKFGGRDAMEMIFQMSPSQYRQASQEAAFFAEWLKRFADGLLDEEKE